MTERIEVQRMIPAPPEAIFEVLCDPQGHVAIDSSGMLQGADGQADQGPSISLTNIHVHPSPG